LATDNHFEKADVVLSLDADFLVSGPGWVRHARDFIDRRRVRRGAAQMNRLYVVESTPTNTGAMADHRRLVRPEFASFSNLKPASNSLRNKALTNTSANT
jgi:hypothetical protein